MNMKQEWKYIPDYEGLYKINLDGTVISYEKKWVTGRGKGRLHLQKSMVISPFISKHGYLRISLSKNGIAKKFQLHRLIAICFVEGFFEGAIINHIDGNKLNNAVSNLEWVTTSDNGLHAFKTGLSRITDKNRIDFTERNKSGMNVNAKKVVDTETGKIYDCINDAAKEKNISVGSLYQYLRGTQKNKTSIRYA